MIPTMIPTMKPPMKPLRHAFVLLVAGMIGCQDGASDDSRISTTGPTKLTTTFLPNAVRIHEKVVSGGLPDGDDAFDELKSLGIKTIISVDGAKPDLDIAKRHGMRYVHLPIGYDGMTLERMQELAKAVTELEGPIYIHCHHGRHRSPAAASVACIGAGMIPAQQGMVALHIAGTSENYRGLFQAVQQGHPLDEALLEQLHVEYRETVPLPPIAEAMVAMEHTADHLQLIADAGWQSPAKHPDLTAGHEALMLFEHYTELLRDPSVQAKPAPFQQLLRDGQATVAELQQTLLSREDDRQPAVTSDSDVMTIWGRVQTNCKDCHRNYRDNPRE